VGMGERLGSVKCRELLAWHRTCRFSRATLLHGVTLEQ
jgi:hypothetical protein